MITIVVLIILAGVAINMTIGQNGILTKAKQAKEDYSNAQEKEEIEIARLTNEINSKIVNSREQIMVDKATYEKLLEDVEYLKQNTIRFIDTSKETIKTITAYNQSWTASEDCAALISLDSSGNTPIVYVNDKEVAAKGWAGSGRITSVIYMKKGDIIKTRNDNKGQSYDIKIYMIIHTP